MWHSIETPSVIVTPSVPSTWIRDKHIIVTFFQPWPKAAHRSARMGVHKMQSWSHWHQGDHCPQENDRKSRFSIYSLLQTLPLQVHMKVHSTEKAFSCPECGTGFRHKNSLVRHRWSWHSNIFITAHDPSRWQHQESRPQKCPLCTRQFVAASRLKSHLRAAHTQVSSSRSQTMLIHLKKEAQQCEQEQCFFIMEVLQVILASKM